MRMFVSNARKLGIMGGSVIVCTFHQIRSIATCNGLDSPGFKSHWGGGGKIFLDQSRPALGPTQPPMQWLLCLSER
jgi:hypothetical protein